ncbi:hypothetical protein NMG60_11019413 [Bertholletia excelsa]
MNLVQYLLERLRPLVNTKSWDYCVLWKLADDQRFLEWIDCCCAGSESVQTEGEHDLLLPVSSVPPCRDVLFPHQRTRPCDLLAQLPSSMPLDSGIYGQALLSNQAKWLNFSNNSDSNALDETIGTRVLVPVLMGLVELFVAKQVPEDPQVIEYITTILVEQQPMDQSFPVNMSINEAQSDSFPPDDQRELNSLFQPPEPVPKNPTLPYEISVDRIQLCNSPKTFLQPSNCSIGSVGFFNGSTDSCLTGKMMNNNPFRSLSDNGFQDMDDGLQKDEGLGNKQEQQGTADKDSVKQETGRSESISDCSDGNEDEEDAKCRRRTGKGPQSKNLVAERKRRKKLNDRLYALRALVPKISKLDRASILGDAIEFVKELQKQVKDLQMELEEQSDDDVPNASAGNGPPEILNPSGFHVGSSASNGVVEPAARQNNDPDALEKLRQMESQVDVAQLDGNEFYVKVFCEHKRGGFLRLMEALASLGLEVTNVNMTSFRALVSNVFKVEMRESEVVHADHVRDSLLEVTRNPSMGWPEMAKVEENGNGGTEYHQHGHRSHHHYLHGHQVNSHHHHHHHFHN